MCHKICKLLRISKVFRGGGGPRHFWVILLCKFKNFEFSRGGAGDHACNVIYFYLDYFQLG